MSDPQEAATPHENVVFDRLVQSKREFTAPLVSATPSDPHSAEAPVWRDAWRTFQDPYLGPDTEKFPSPFESFVAGYMAAVRSRDAEVAELKAKIAEIRGDAHLTQMTPNPNDTGAYVLGRNAEAALFGSASSPVEGGN